MRIAQRGESTSEMNDDSVNQSSDKLMENVYVSPQGYHIYLRFENVGGPLRIEGAVIGYSPIRLEAIFERGKSININLFDQQLYGPILISELARSTNHLRAVFRNTGAIKKLEDPGK